MSEYDDNKKLGDQNRQAIEADMAKLPRWRWVLRRMFCSHRVFKVLGVNGFHMHYMCPNCGKDCGWH